MPSGERALWERTQRTRVAEQEPPADDRQAYLETLCAEAIRMRAACPELWEVLDVCTRPRAAGNAAAGYDAILPPPSDMTFGERAAYVMGQDSVGIWLRSLAEPKQEEVIDDG